ncbi:hypothetical protein CRM22_001636, partial [Opisthorchis felineus]
MTYLNSQPLQSCQLGLNRLVQGCSVDSTGPDKLLTVGNFCPNYCSNVLRGCLAAPLLFWPIQTDGSDMDEQRENQTPLQRLLASPRQGPARNQIQAAFDQLLSSLNATGLMNLISHGLQNAQQDLHRIVKEVTMTYLNSQPLQSCQLGLNRLVQGCSVDSTGPDKLLTVGNFCPNYCSNVLRGCLAAPLLFWPIQTDGSDMDEQRENQTPLQRLLASPRQGPARNQIQAAFDQLLSSLNATGLMNLISHGLQNAQQDLHRIVKE